MKAIDKMRSLTAAIMVFTMTSRAQVPHANLSFHQPHKRNMLLEKKTQHFKFTATMMPGNKFVQNSEFNLAGGLNYEVRAKMYLNRKVSLLMKTKNRTRNSHDVASFGIIFKL